MDKTIVKKFKEGNKDAALAVLHKWWTRSTLSYILQIQRKT